MRKRLAFLVVVSFLWMAGASAPIFAYEKGSLHWTEESRRHVEERHLRRDAYPFKSKFLEGISYEVLGEEAFHHGQARREPNGRWVYDWDKGEQVGNLGQTGVRLVTESDGTVVTLYPIFVEADEERH